MESLELFLDGCPYMFLVRFRRHKPTVPYILMFLHKAGTEIVHVAPRDKDSNIERVSVVDRGQGN